MTVGKACFARPYSNARLEKRELLIIINALGSVMTVFAKQEFMLVILEKNWSCREILSQAAVPLEH